MTINGILFVLSTGCRWRDMPRSYGAPATAWRRLKQWSDNGIWESIMMSIQKTAYKSGKLSLKTISVDSSLIESKKGASSSNTTATRRKTVLNSMPQ
jgi:transposase